MDVLAILEFVAGGTLVSLTSNVILLRNQLKMKKASISLDTIKVYQDIAESNNQTLKEQNEKIVLLQRKVSHLEIIVIRVKECIYFPVCPVSKLVQDYQRKFLARNDGLTHDVTDDKHNTPSNAGVEGCDDDTNRLVDCPS